MQCAVEDGDEDGLCCAGGYNISTLWTTIMRAEMDAEASTPSGALLTQHPRRPPRDPSIAFAHMPIAMPSQHPHKYSPITA